MSDAFDARIALAAVDFQNEVQIWGSLPPPLAGFLQTEVFPVSAPPSLRGAAHYGGTKVLVHERRHLCFARFFDGGRTDAYRRAIPSARVLVLDLDVFRNGFRNYSALRDHLDEVADVTGVQFDKQLRLLRSMYQKADVTRSDKAFRTLVGQSAGGIDVVARAMGLLVDRRQLVVYARNFGLGENLVAALFALAPIELIARTTWCTSVESLAVSHEDVVLYRGELAPTRETPSWTARLRARLRGEDRVPDAAIDVTSGVTCGHTRDGAARARLAERLVRELFANSIRLTLGFADRFRIYLGIMGALCSERPYNVSALVPSDGDDTSGIVDKIETFLARQ